MITSKDNFDALKVRELVELECIACGKHFFKTKRDINAGIRMGRDRCNHCSKECLESSRSSPIIEKRCTACGTLFKSKECHNRKVCSPQCGAINSSKARNANNRVEFCCNNCGKVVITSKHKMKKRKHLKNGVCKECNTQKKMAEIVELECCHCKSKFNRFRRELRKNKHGKYFCSKECNARFFMNVTLVSKASKVSMAEVLLSDLIIKDFPLLAISRNDRVVLPSKLEFDLYFPDIKFAIELNGPTHYMPIYGDKALEKTQFKDNIKFVEANRLGISLLVIDISRLSGRGVTVNFINKYYLETIKPLLEFKIVENIQNNSP